MSTLFLYSYDTCGVCFIFQTWGSGRSMWGGISHCSVSLHPGSVLQLPHHWWGSVSTSWGEWDRSLIKIASFKALRARLQWLRQIALSCRQVEAHLWLRGQVISSQQQECCFRKANRGFWSWGVFQSKKIEGLMAYIAITTLDILDQGCFRWGK